MEFSKTPGLALNLPGRNYLEASKFHRCKNHGWLTTGFNFQEMKAIDAGAKHGSFVIERRNRLLITANS